MTRTTALLVLLVAAALEAGGDALVRVGLHANVLWQRAATFALGAIVLFAYGCTVNAPPWDFGKLIGVYIVFFFLIAQLLVDFQAHSLARSFGGGNAYRSGRRDHFDREGVRCDLERTSREARIRI